MQCISKVTYSFKQIDVKNSLISTCGIQYMLMFKHCMGMFLSASQGGYRKFVNCPGLVR